MGAPLSFRARWAVPPPKRFCGRETQATKLGEFMIIFRCSCGKQLQVNEDRAGTKVKCPECEEILRVPEAGSIREKSGPASPPPKTRPTQAEVDEGFADEERRPRRRPAPFDESHIYD